MRNMKNDFETKGRIIGIVLAFVVTIAISYSVGSGEGNKSGYAKGFDEGARDAWGRAVVVATEEAYWLGAIDACHTVFDATGWEYIYVNEFAGGGTISREYFCRDSGDHSATPVLEIPYEPASLDSN